MLIKKDERKEKVMKECTVWEYDFKNKSIQFALARINGRYPDSGKGMNKVCYMIYHVIEGRGRLFVDDEEHELKKGDTFLIEPGKKYYIIGQNLILAIPTSPAWYPEQYEIIKE